MLPPGQLPPYSACALQTLPNRTRFPPAGETLSEGGFLPNKVAAASVLDVQEATDKKGKKYYKVRGQGTAAGMGRHGSLTADMSAAEGCATLSSLGVQPGQAGQRLAGQRPVPNHRLTAALCCICTAFSALIADPSVPPALPLPGPLNSTRC